MNPSQKAEYYVTISLTTRYLSGMLSLQFQNVDLTYLFNVGLNTLLSTVILISEQQQQHHHHHQQQQQHYY